MSTTSRPVVFFGTEDFSLESLKALYEAGFHIGLVVTKPDSMRGRNRALTAPAVKLFAVEHDIPYVQPSKMAEAIPYIESLDNPVGVLVSFGKIIPESILDLFPDGITNVHPSLLPKYRGPSPIESAIIHSDSETGVTLMRLEARMDAGPIYLQQRVPLRGDEDQPGLYTSLSLLGSLLLAKNLDDIIQGTIHPTIQDEETATYCSLLSKQDTLIHTSEHDAQWIECKIRAHQSYPKTAVDIDTNRIIITKAHPVTSYDSTVLTLPCKNDSFIAIDELIAPSGKRMNAEAFMRGYMAHS